MRKKIKLSLKGFTLLEIMVVVLIIGVLATLTMSALSNNRKKSRDLKRVSGINSLQAALDVYYKDHGVYPSLITPGMPLKSADGSVTYIDEVPSNPQPRNDNGCPDSEFIYTVGANNKTYSLAGCIGDEKISGKPKLIYGTREAIFHCGDTITDRDGFTYRTASIGTQCWTIDYLKTRTNPDGTCINQNMTTSYNGHLFTIGPPPACQVYDNGVLTNQGGWTLYQSAGTSGRDCISQTTSVEGTENDCINGNTLYSWLAAMAVTPTNPLTFNPPGPQYQFTARQGICPDGWHIPTSDEFTTLERFVCTSSTCATDFPYNITSAGDLGTNEGAALRAGGSSGFNAFPIGQRRPHPTYTTMPAVFYNPSNGGDFTFLWVATYDSVYNQMGRRIIYQSGYDKINRKYTDASHTTAYPVRCIKD